MQPRFDFAKASPESYKAVFALEQYIRSCGLEPRHIHLLKLRASQINGCAYCVDTHVKEARHDGLSEQWINLVCAWRESPLYDARERALLEWTEAVTNVAQTGVPDAPFAEIRKHFSEEEIVKITTAIGTINVWNRLSVSFRSQHPIDEREQAA
ncbi:carboxymuconolactone decarboxylase family protein [Ciceribacter sp. RN22]|uniref:carboxymuconolactone decarboxylase family protein n=1 Tax=Ciceribacter sp. RN22 TaxID=2954932 RepID=UPI002092DDA1|nr:carboxymuconolactone decarboxylase family protein [Ciceribacter sp. RN22]MCO6176633.1 carboxymuconolactone decarboxylase family protein [Ciceribacter sp. RN22]